MDVVLRTPHGDGDFTIAAVPTGTTIGDLLGIVTGQAPPSTARVDGRLIATSTQITDANIVIGSLIDTRLEATQRPTDQGHVLHIAQLAGRGAGSVVGFAPGRYRIGSGRRANAPELESAAVETGAFELTVVEGMAPRISPSIGLDVAYGPYSAAIGHDHLDSDIDWNGGDFNVGGRVFQVAEPDDLNLQRASESTNPDGTIPFRRSAAMVSAERPLMIGARRAASRAGGSLWHRRPDDPDAFHIPFGIHRNGVTTTSVDLAKNVGVGLIGSHGFATALARTLLIELATLHGPADIDIAIATSPTRRGEWSWARWLPHLHRGGPDSPAEIFSEPSEHDALARSIQNRAHEPSTESRLTLIVIDGLELWAERDSPLRSVATTPPPGVRLLVVCGDLREAPALCTELIEEVQPARALERAAVTAASPSHSSLLGSLADLHIRSSEPAQVVSDIRPALVEPDLASDIARALAPLDDIDAQRAAPAQPAAVGPTLDDIVAFARSDATLQPRESWRVPVGTESPPSGVAAATPTPVFVALTRRTPTWLVTATTEHHEAAIATLALGAAAQHRVDELAILIVGREPHSWQSDLAHLAGWASHSDVADPARLLQRIEHVLSEQPGLSLLIIVEHALDAPAGGALVDGVTSLAASLADVHLVLTRSEAERTDIDQVAENCSTIWIGQDGQGSVSEPASDHTRDTASVTSFIGVVSGPVTDTPPFDAPDLVVQPSRHGRPLTPLERRLERTSMAPSSLGATESEAASIARNLTDVQTSPSTPRVALLPPALPDEVPQSLLLERDAGKGVPLGLLDRPESASSDVYWWQPGSNGSLLVLGSPRSGMNTILDLLITGIASRVAADDLHVYAIEALPQRRRGLGALPHIGNVIGPDDPGAVVALINRFHSALGQRIAARRSDDLPDLLLLIGDVGRISRGLPADVADAVFRQLGDIAATGGTVGINLVAVAGRIDDLGGIERVTGDKLVGAVTEPSDRVRLGAPRSGPDDRQIGRCWSIAENRRIQLATPPDSLELEIAVIAPQAAQHRAAPDFAAMDLDAGAES